MSQRKISAVISKFIRARIPLTDEQLDKQNATEIFCLAMRAMEGIMESGGNNRGPLVAEILKTIGLPSGTSWCMAMIQTALRFAELYSGDTSKVVSSGHCLTTYRDSPAACKVPTTSLRAGDLIIFQHGKTEDGHVEGVTGSLQGLLAYTVGGNTSAGVGVNRDGDGVYHRMRSLVKPEGDMTIFGILRPFP